MFVDFRGGEENFNLHFKWPVQDKAHFVYAELANLLCIAFASVFRGNHCRKTKCAFLRGATLDALWETAFMLRVVVFRGFRFLQHKHEQEQRA